MIKKTTLFLLLGAIALGAAVYYFDWRRSQKESEKPPADAAKLAFSIQPQDIRVTNKSNAQQSCCKPSRAVIVLVRICSGDK